MTQISRDKETKESLSHTERRGKKTNAFGVYLSHTLLLLCRFRPLYSLLITETTETNIDRE